MILLRILFVVIASLLFTLDTRAQGAYETFGDATALTADTFQLTLDAPWSNGSVWYKLKHNFDSPFAVYGQMFFGDLDNGADGIVFAIQNECLVAGTSGMGIGYQNFPGSSLGVEFDTYQNSGAPSNDPLEDHLAIHQNGSIDHLTNLAGPVQMSATQTDVEDNTWHTFSIVYNPSTTMLEVTFDGSLRLSYNVDITNTILGGSPLSYWGFTSATGGNFADNSIKIDSVTAFTLNDTTICPGSATVNLPELDGFKSSLNATATASSVETVFSAANATDGNLGTRWSSAFMDPQWITVDLGSSLEVDSVVLYWEGAYGLEYYIQTSNDNMTWTDQFYEPAGNGGTDIISFPATNARYVRMYGLQRGTIYGYSLYEFDVFTEQQYAWTPNDGTVSDTSSNNPTFTPNATTTYTLTIPDPCLGSTTFDYTVIVDCSPLPVELLSFDGHAIENQENYLYWVTNTELNNDYFELHRSLNGSQWEAIGEIAGMGTSLQQHYYDFYDRQINPTAEGYYYRLKQVDFDGAYEFSQVIFIPNITSTSQIVLFPNPATFSFEIISEVEVERVRMFSISGKEVTLNNTLNGYQFNAAPGIYVVEITNNQNVQISKKLWVE